YASAEARRAETYAFDRVQIGKLVAEPAARLRAGIARKEALHAELVVDLVPDLLSPHVAHPGCQFARGHAVGNAREEGETLMLVLPVIGCAVAHLCRAVDDRVESLKRRHQLARGINLDRQPPIGRGGDTVGQALGADTQTREI